jgi:hypothetical protein
MKMKTKLFFLVTFFIISLGLFAVTINGFNYKTIIYNNGVVVQNQAVVLRFTLYNNTVAFYQESHSVTSDKSGLVIVNIGEGVVIMGAMTAADPTQQMSYKVEISLGSGIFTDMGTFNFKQIPYALHANSAAKLDTPLSVNSLTDAKNDGLSLFIGTNAGSVDDGSNMNVGIGNYSMLKNTSGIYNTAIGRYSLSNNISGDNNVSVGYYAGYNSIGNGNVFLGSYAGANETGSNKLYIANSNTTTPLILGDFSAKQLTINGDLSIKDGTQGAGKVFTSDATGNGSWQNNAKTNSIILPPSSVQVISEDVSYFRTYYRFYIATNSNYQVNLPIHLPVGALINSITYYYYDNSISNIRFQFVSTTITSLATSSNYIFTSNTATTAVQEYVSTSNYIIQEDRVYNIVIDANGSAWPGNSDLSFRGVKITYTY